MHLTEGHVLTCLAKDCSFNCESMCCAPEVMIGDAHPQCDMYTTAEKSLAKHSPRVQQCMVGDCHFNKQRTCEAAGITLMTHADHADCATYRV